MNSGMRNGSFKDARVRAALIAGCTVFVSPAALANGPSGASSGVAGLGSTVIASRANVQKGSVLAAALQLDATLAVDREAPQTRAQTRTAVAMSLPEALLSSPFGASAGPSAATGSQDWGDPAITVGPLTAQSIRPGMRVTIVASRAAEGQPQNLARVVHALVQAPGQLVSWVRLPLDVLPESTFVLEDGRIICLSSPPGESLPGERSELVALDSGGRLLARKPLSDLLPPGTRRSGANASLMSTSSGACLGVPLVCGSMALVEFGQSGPQGGAVATAFEMCSVVLSEKFACGVEAWLDQARKLIRDGDVEAARFALDAAIETDPSDARGYRELAHFHRRRGETSEQLECLQSGVSKLHANVVGAADDDWQVGTPAARLTVDYLNAARNVHDLDLTEEVLDRALELYPCMEQLVLMRAEISIERGELDKAIASLRAALGQVDPNADLAAAHHDVGRFLRRQSFPAEALPFFEDAYALGDHSEFLLRGLADLSVELGKDDRAAAWLTILVERWREASAASTEDTRAERAQVRLRELEAEIAALLAKEE